MNLLKSAFLIFTLFAALAIAQYDGENEIEEDDLDSDEVDDDGDRETRQVVPYAEQAPSGECIRAWYDLANCGGFRSGTGGSCDRHCLSKGFPYSWCRPHYCLCHKGRDLGRECEINGK